MSPHLVKEGRSFPPPGGKKSNHFFRRRTPGWSLLPLRGNSPSVRREKFLSRSEVSRPRLRRGKAPERRAIAIAPAEPGWGCLGERADPFPRILSVRKCETGPPRWGGPVSRAVGLFFHSLWRLCRQSEEIPRWGRRQPTPTKLSLADLPLLREDQIIQVSGPIPQHRSLLLRVFEITPPSYAPTREKLHERGQGSGNFSLRGPVLKFFRPAP